MWRISRNKKVTITKRNALITQTPITKYEKLNLVRPFMVGFG